MPGNISTSYAPVWGTSANCDRVREAIVEVKDKLGKWIGGPPAFILRVVDAENGEPHAIPLTTRELRILRFACRVALEEDSL